MVVAVLALLFVSLSATVHLRLDAEFDLEVTRWVQQVFPHLVDIPFSLLSIVGSAEVTVVAFALTLLLYPRGVRWPLVALFVLLTAIEFAGKSFIDQPGPSHIFYRFVLPFPIPIVEVPTRYSFPSGHAARSMFLVIVWDAWVVSRSLTRRVKGLSLIILVAGELVMLVSRIYVGEHWATDVMGGALLGAALALPVALTEWRAGSRIGNVQ